MDNNMGMFLSLFKIYTNYLEVVKLNKNNKKNQELISVSKFTNVDTDPLNCDLGKETNLVFRVDDKSGKSKSKRTPKGIKRKYLMDPSETEKNIKEKREKKKKNVAVLETHDGVSQDEFYRLTGIKKENKLHLRQPRRWWVREEYTDRDISGYYAATFKKMKTNNSVEFFELTRMEIPIYEKLSKLLRQSLTKTSIRTPISHECRLAVTLTYLSQSTPLFQLSTTFQIGKSTIRELILDTCDVIWKILSPEYCPALNANDCESISNEFLRIWGLPNCIGIFDSKVLEISMPCRQRRSGPYDANLKHLSFSFVCDTNHLITWSDVQPYQREQEPPDIFDNSLLQIPGEKCLPQSNINFPHYFAGDDIHPLKKYLMCPYPTVNLDTESKKTFNQYITAVRSITENTFGILAARWTVLQTEFKCYPINSKKIILAVVVLHNFIMKNSLTIQNLENRYCPYNFVDYHDESGNFHEGEWRRELQKQYQQANFESHDTSKSTYLLRDLLANYLHAAESSIITT